MKSVLEVLDALELDRSFAPDIEIGWRESMGTYPANGLFFMEREFYREHLEMMEVEDNLLPMMDDVAIKVNRSCELSLLAWHAHHYLCHFDALPSFSKWPGLAEILDDNCGIFYLMIGLSAIPVFTQTYRNMGIPEEYAVAATGWLKGTIGIYKSAHDGYPGHTKSQLYWVRHYIDGRLFRIGRFEFMEQGFPEHYKISVYKSRISGQVIALAAAGVDCSADGLVMYADQAPETAAFTTSFFQDKTCAVGNPVSPEGFILDCTVKLILSEWECVLAPGDFAPGIHIPGGGKMSLEVCRQSLADAHEFYKKYFPRKTVKAFVCGSWIFNPDLERVLPESNLAKFMRQIYLFPMLSTGKDGLFFIFGKDYGDISQYPRDNSVRRAMLSIFDEGKRLRVGGMFYLPEHLDQFGTEYYRRNWTLSTSV